MCLLNKVFFFLLRFSITIIYRLYSEKSQSLRESLPWFPSAEQDPSAPWLFYNAFTALSLADVFPDFSIHSQFVSNYVDCEVA
jgi:hypothetical protein